MSYKTIALQLIILIFLNSCSGFFKKTDARQIPTSGPERAKKNLEEGRGVSLNKIKNSIGGGTFEFSTSNPLWRASIEVLDFLPLSNVDYSGGMIITDWYSEKKDNEALKISIRFLSNEISAASLKIIIHQRICDSKNNCSVKLIDSKITEELTRTILSKATILEKNKKN